MEEEVAEEPAKPEDAVEEVQAVADVEEEVVEEPEDVVE
jgi:hypothetical protein